MKDQLFYCCVSVDSKPVFRGHQQGNPLVYDVNFAKQEMKITVHLEDYEQILFEKVSMRSWCLMQRSSRRLCRSAAGYGG